MVEVRVDRGMAGDGQLECVVTDFNFDAYGNDPEDMVIKCTRCDWIHRIFTSYRLNCVTLSELNGIANDHAELAHG